MAFQIKITQLLDAHETPYCLLPHSEPVFTVDAAAQQRGVIKEELELDPQDLIRVAGARLAPIAKAGE